MSRPHASETGRESVSSPGQFRSPTAGTKPSGGALALSRGRGRGAFRRSIERAIGRLEAKRPPVPRVGDPTLIRSCGGNIMREAPQTCAGALRFPSRVVGRNRILMKAGAARVSHRENSGEGPLSGLLLVLAC